jgi:phenylacetate-coenzyme A ligase PaaK-like adenylate-forming protein
VTSRPSALDAWTARRIGQRSQGLLDAEALRAHQIEALRRLVARVKERSPFYRRRLAWIEPEMLRDLGDLPRLPFTSETDLREQGEDLLCVRPDDVARIVTLRSSGTSGPAKRVFFSAHDLEQTLDFFQQGMRELVQPGQRVLVLLPGATDDSVGDLLTRALAREGIEARAVGLMTNASLALEAAEALKPDCLVGFPVQLRLLARYAADLGRPLRLRSALLCSEYAAPLLRSEFERLTGARTFNHWGATETGLGGGVECSARQGVHLREAELLVEIVASGTGVPLPDGEWGELVVTTLAREAMPLLRYRTGDLARILPGACACGSCLRGIDAVRGRLTQRLLLANGHELGLDRLDDALFAFPEALDYQARLERDAEGELLRVRCATAPKSALTMDAVLQTLSLPPELATTEFGPAPRLELELFSSLDYAPLQPGKRTLDDVRRSA